MKDDVSARPPGRPGAFGHLGGAGLATLRQVKHLALLPALVVLVVVGGVLNPSFLTHANLVSILSSSAALAFVVLAESLVIIVGKFDLSLESVVGIAPALGAMLVVPKEALGFGADLPTAVGLAVIPLVGGLIGALNGFLVVRMRLNAFIVTLAMLIVLRGLQVGAVKGGTLFDMPDAFFTLATATVLGLPLSVWAAGLAFLVASVVLRYHRLGRALYAIGGNPEAARAAGIRVERITGAVFVLAGALAAVGGLIVTGYVGAINANQSRTC